MARIGTVAGALALLLGPVLLGCSDDGAEPEDVARVGDTGSGARSGLVSSTEDEASPGETQPSAAAAVELFQLRR